MAHWTDELVIRATSATEPESWDRVFNGGGVIMDVDGEPYAIVEADGAGRARVTPLNDSQRRKITDA